MRRPMRKIALIGAISGSCVASGHGFIQFPVPSDTGRPGWEVRREARLEWLTMSTPVVLEAMVDSIHNAVELWFFAGTYDGTPAFHRPFYTPITVTPIEYHKGRGPERPFVVFGEGGLDRGSGVELFRPAAFPASTEEGQLREGNLVFLFLQPAYPCTVAVPDSGRIDASVPPEESSPDEGGTPSPPAPFDPLPFEPVLGRGPGGDRELGIPVVTQGKAFKARGGRAVSHPDVGGFFDRPYLVEEFRDRLRGYVETRSLASLTEAGCWSEIEVLGAQEEGVPPDSEKLYGFPLSLAQVVIGRPIWTTCELGPEVIFRNAIQLDFPGKDFTWSQELVPVNVGDNLLVCLQASEDGDWRTVGGRDGVIRLDEQGNVRRLRLTGAGMFVEELVSVSSLKAEIEELLGER